MISFGVPLTPSPPLIKKIPVQVRGQQMIDEAFRDIPPGKTIDYHTHILTHRPHKKGGGYINPRLLTWQNPLARLKTNFYMKGSGVTDLTKVDSQFLARLVQRVRDIPHHGKYYLLAFDQNYDRHGNPQPHKSEFYVPNDYVWEVANKYPDLFIPTISVHPYRKDALQELDRWGQKGVKLIKWLPNAQSIQADHPNLDPYYEKVRQYGMTILTHVGEEKAVHAKEDQWLGNPLLFRRPLERGVHVMMAHGGSLGKCEDFDAPQDPKVPCFELVLRLMRQPKYKKQLTMDISATTQRNRVPEPLIAFLGATDLHARIFNGSDYPLPAVDIVISLRKLVYHRLLDAEDVKPLREIFRQNPLLFDFVLKRRLRHPKTKVKFPASVFIKKEN